MFVSKARFEEMKARAERAENELYQFLSDIRTDRSFTPQATIHTDVKLRALEPIEQRELVPLPPVVEEAITQRVPPGSDIAASLTEQARSAMERLGSDFDAEAFAENIRVGTRVRGWPL